MNSCTGICNLTASADRLRMGERAGAPQAFTRNGMSAQIIGSISGMHLENGTAERDTIYIVTAGSGIIASGDEEVDFTSGDVLFVPAHIEHRLGQLSRKFRAWKILLRSK